MQLYTGSYTRMGGPGIGVCEWTGSTFRLLSTSRELEDPIYVILSADGKTLYAVGSDASDDGMAASYSVKGDRLTFLSVQPTGGRASCHLTLSRDERFLYTANYLTGSVSVFPVQNGILGQRIQLLQHEGSGPNPDRQEAAHTHQCLFRPETDELFVCDLGTDRIAVYTQDPKNGMLRLREEIVMPAGMGPRHLIFADAYCFYVTGELDNVVRRCVLRDGTWQITDACSTLPENWRGKNLTAALRLHGGALYVSNRGHDSICRIPLDCKGNMLAPHWVSTNGLYPRDFILTADGFLAANQNGGGITAENGASLPMDGAVCICPAP